jgi:hypothetical protein
LKALMMSIFDMFGVAGVGCGTADIGGLTCLDTRKLFTHL